ncbi:hypothetical protein CFIICLFH_3828 [Methylobacterium goesingense]|nr:hypothetical protein CFIICLFH_3828 [Methylobacterium goesingense]
MTSPPAVIETALALPVFDCTSTRPLALPLTLVPAPRLMRVSPVPWLPLKTPWPRYGSVASVPVAVIVPPVPTVMVEAPPVAADWSFTMLDVPLMTTPLPRTWLALPPLLEENEAGWPPMPVMVTSTCLDTVPPWPSSTVTVKLSTLVWPAAR